jgi:hypothetical protein
MARAHVHLRCLPPRSVWDASTAGIPWPTARTPPTSEAAGLLAQTDCYLGSWTLFYRVYIRSAGCAVPCLAMDLALHVSCYIYMSVLVHVLYRCAYNVHTSCVCMCDRGQRLHRSMKNLAAYSTEYTVLWNGILAALFHMIYIGIYVHLCTNDTSNSCSCIGGKGRHQL